jgi:hypothetical protein
VTPPPCVSRALGKGSGASIRGQILTRVHPDAFADLVKGRRIASVTGTNGKTTTTHFLAAALRTASGRTPDGWSRTPTARTCTTASPRRWRRPPTPTSPSWRPMSGS